MVVAYEGETYNVGNGCYNSSIVSSSTGANWSYDLDELWTIPSGGAILIREPDELIIYCYYYFYWDNVYVIDVVEP